jgi:hypothetical protein
LSGLAEFLRANQKIELSVEVECTEEGIEAAIEAANQKLCQKGGVPNNMFPHVTKSKAANIWASAIARPNKAVQTYLLKGKCTLSLDQLSADGLVREVCACVFDVCGCVSYVWTNFIILFCFIFCCVHFNYSDCTRKIK